MAGIGFELRKMFRQRGHLSNIRAYAFSSLVTVGPMLLCILMVTFLQQLLIYMDISYLERMAFLCAVQYAFIFSLLLTCGFNMSLSRYIADKIYLKEYEDIIASMYGVISVCLLVGGILGACFYFVSPLDAAFKIPAYLLFIELVVVWLQSTYLTALKDYMRIVKGYGIAGIVAIASALVFMYLLDVRLAVGMLLSLDLGFFVMIIMSAVHLESFFQRTQRNYFRFLTYLEKYPTLLFTGLFSSLGFYIHNFIYWLIGPLQESVANTYVIAPSYDVPAFYASLTILPTMVVFVVSVETSFYDKYRDYYATILGTGSLQTIMRAKQDMINVLMQEISFMMELQLFFTLVSLALGINFLPEIGFTSAQVETYNILVIADFLYVAMFVITLLLLYFDDRVGAFIITCLFVGSTTLLTLAMLPFNSYGFSFFIAAFLSVVAALVRLVYFLRNIDYYTFCSQPLVIKEKKSIVSRLVDRLD